MKLAQLVLGSLLLFYVHLGGVVYVRTIGEERYNYWECII